MLWLLYVVPMRLKTYLNPTPHGIPATVAMSVHTKKAKKGEGLTHSFPFPPPPLPPPTPHPTHTPRLSYYALSRGLEVQFDTFLFSYPSSRASSIQLYCQVSTVLVNVPLAALVWHLVGAWPCLTPGHTFKRQGMIMVVCAIILLAFALYFLLIDPFLCQSVSLRKFVNRSWLSARDTERAAGGADGVDGVDGAGGGGARMPRPISSSISAENPMHSGQHSGSTRIGHGSEAGDVEMEHVGDGAHDMHGKVNSWKKGVSTRAMGKGQAGKGQAGKPGHKGGRMGEKKALSLSKLDSKSFRLETAGIEEDGVPVAARTDSFFRRELVSGTCE